MVAKTPLFLCAIKTSALYPNDLNQAQNQF